MRQLAVSDILDPAGGIHCQTARQSAEARAVIYVLAVNKDRPATFGDFVDLLDDVCDVSLLTHRGPSR